MNTVDIVILVVLGVIVGLLIFFKFSSKNSGCDSCAISKGCSIAQNTIDSKK